MLRRSTPILRTGFKRQIYVPPPSPPVTRCRGGVMATYGDDVVTITKEKPLHSSTYQSRVRGLACVRCGITGFTQFCHSDEGKGMAMKTDDRRGWPGCGPHLENGAIVNGCHWLVGTSGKLKRQERRDLEAEYARRTREAILRQGKWPASLPLWDEPIKRATQIGRAFD
jgi:hypothetical protein